jgi:hypothetical protein
MHVMRVLRHPRRHDEVILAYRHLARISQHKSPAALAQKAAVGIGA